MKEKLFIVNGANSKALERDNLNGISIQNLSKIFDITEIGSNKTGFNGANFNNVFETSGNVINILLMAHGEVDEKGQYKLFTHYANKQDKIKDFLCQTPILEPVKGESYEEIWTSANVFVKKLVEITGGNKPIKIFAASCEGANLHAETSNLPNNSEIITISNKDHVTDPMDMFDINMEKFYELTFDGNKNFEKLLFISSLSQKLTQNVPIVSCKKDNQVNEINLKDFTEEFFKLRSNYEFSSMLENLFKQGVFNKEHILELMVKTKEKGLDQFKVNSVIIEEISNAQIDGTIGELKSKLEIKCYPPNTLDKIELNKQGWSLSIKNKIAELEKNLSEVSSKEIAELQSIIAEQLKDFKKDQYAYTPLGTNYMLGGDEGFESIEHDNFNIMLLLGVEAFISDL